MSNRRDADDDHIELLLVEDDEEDRDLLLNDLKAQAACRYRVTYAGLLQEAMDLFDSRSFDVVLLDLGLPDSQGLDTFFQLHEKAPEVPIVVITGQDDDIVSMQALKAGAQDYLVKGRIVGDLLKRSIRYSIERQQLLLRIEKERFLSEQERERTALEQLVAPPPTSITACLYGRRPLREVAPEAFGQLVDRYAMVLDKAIERRILKVQESPASELRRMAEEMGSLYAGPRDVLDLHMQALRRGCEGQPTPKVKALTEEGRFLMVELMGYLVSFYRDYYPGSNRAGTRCGSEAATRETKP